MRMKHPDWTDLKTSHKSLRTLCKNKLLMANLTADKVTPLLRYEPLPGTAVKFFDRTHVVLREKLYQRKILRKKCTSPLVCFLPSFHRYFCFQAHSQHYLITTTPLGFMVLTQNPYGLQHQCTSGLRCHHYLGS